MRIVTWNCRVGGFRHKAKHIAPLRPDVLAIQEVESLEGVASLTGDYQPTFRHRVTAAGFPRRGSGMFSYSDISMTPVDAECGFARYAARRGQLEFQVAGVWPWATRTKRTSYRQAHEGLVQHADWIRQRPTVVLGDFNANKSYQGDHWRDLEQLLNGLGLISAYHAHRGEEFGRETMFTHFHRGAADRGFHLDYCFVPSTWANRIAGVTIEPYAAWATVSDHVPVIVDVDL